MKKFIFAAFLLLSELADAAPAHQCSEHALKQAEKLLAFSSGEKDRIEIDPNVKILSPIKNPANKTQSFDVLEVSGFIYRSTYKMRFIYIQMKDDCGMVGQEILEDLKS